MNTIKIKFNTNDLIWEKSACDETKKRENTMEIPQTECESVMFIKLDRSSVACVSRKIKSLDNLPLNRIYSINNNFSLKGSVS